MKSLREFLIVLLLGSLLFPGCAFARSVAVIDVANLTGYYIPQLSEVAAETLSILLSQTETITVVEREKLRAILDEQELTLAGVVQVDSSAAELGRLIGVQYIITGSILSLSHQSKAVYAYGVNLSKASIELSVSAKVLNTASGRLEYAEIFDSSVPSGAESIEQAIASGEHQKLLRQVMGNVATAVVAQLADITPREVNLATLEFMSDPPGAKVEINGLFHGNTPLTVSVPEGVYQVRVELSGHSPWESMVKFVDGLTISATLSPINIGKGDDE